ncbi:Uncharacterised protein [Streptococcus pneumoniae]|nr:Uncharacterised protein [Streptococcus pneumoniae]CJB70801.1 Uncharacterised protein [Streptococcus pneumoniae]CJJ24828.1 Uncharacterised protein [Streptococcus pneumoniae]CJX97884.1 Uncharacterised protein [Streptococcus pneumoniae]
MSATVWIALSSCTMAPAASLSAAGGAGGAGGVTGAAGAPIVFVRPSPVVAVASTAVSVRLSPDTSES